MTRSGQWSLQVTEATFRRFLIDTPLTPSFSAGGVRFGSYHQQYWVDGGCLHGHGSAHSRDHPRPTNALLEWFMSPLCMMSSYLVSSSRGRPRATSAWERVPAALDSLRRDGIAQQPAEASALLRRGADCGGRGGRAAALPVVSLPVLGPQPVLARPRQAHRAQGDRVGAGRRGALPRAALVPHGELRSKAARAVTPASRHSSLPACGSPLYAY